MALTTFRICEGNKESPERRQGAPPPGDVGAVNLGIDQAKQAQHQLLSAVCFITLAEKRAGGAGEGAERRQLIRAGTALIYNDLLIRSACPINTAEKKGNNIRAENCLFKG